MKRDPGEVLIVEGKIELTYKCPDCGKDHLVEAPSLTNIGGMISTRDWLSYSQRCECGTYLKVHSPSNHETIS